MSDRNLMSTPGTPVGLSLEETVLSRVFVGPPYLALRPVAWQGGLLGAQARLQLRDAVGLSPEAQLLRHVALAGLCAGALAQPDDTRRHYIVQELHAVVQSAPEAGQIELSSQVVDLDQRSLRAEVHVSSGTQLLASSNVLYTVLSGEAFGRLFARRQREEAAVVPDWSRPLPAGTRTRTGDRLVREVAALPAETCAGTLFGARALPASSLVGHLTALAGELFAQPSSLMSVGLQVSDLCWAGEDLCFEVRPQEGAEEQDGRRAYAGSVHAGPHRRLVARGQLVLARSSHP
ncbi:hypothetical protein [Deinococcus petrolearius]|uniref:A-factor biosynthesis hotdog domain-containing protein n=1 Tax=Deinococcus petrolearius TaxID=1751295 RepID=A0ABW1DL47_9DEIO